jgi:hypothetical protein
VALQPTRQACEAGSQYCPEGHGSVRQVARAGRDPQMWFVRLQTPAFGQGVVSSHPTTQSPSGLQISPGGQAPPVQATGGVEHVLAEQVSPSIQSVSIWHPAAHTPPALQ